MQRRKDSAGKVLKDGESERKNGYQYRYMSEGKRKYIYAKTLHELRQKEKNIGVEKTDYTVDDMFEKYIGIKRKTIAKNTCASYERNYKNHIAPVFKDRLIKDVKKSEVVDFLLGLDLKGGTIHKIHCVLYGIFEFALDDELITKNPCHNATKGIKVPLHSRKALTLEEQRLFLKGVKETCPSFYPIFSFMLETGVRVGEVCALRWEDVDFEKKVVDIRHSLKYYIRNKVYMEIGAPKTAKSIRQIPLTQIALDNLSEEKQRQKYNNIMCNTEIDNYTDFVFLGKEGTIRNFIGLNKQIKKVVKKYDGLPEDLSCHILRHTFCTRLCESNVNIKVIQQLMGHSSIKTTMDVYTEVTKNFAIDEFRKFEEFIHH